MTHLTSSMVGIHGKKHLCQVSPYWVIISTYMRGRTFLPHINNGVTKDPITNRAKYFLLLGLNIAVYLFAWLLVA